MIRYPPGNNAYAKDVKDNAYIESKSLRLRTLHDGQIAGGEVLVKPMDIASALNPVGQPHLPATSRGPPSATIRRLGICLRSSGKALPQSSRSGFPIPVPPIEQITSGSCPYSSRWRRPARSRYSAGSKGQM